jgi:hypothetical protein
MKPPGRQEREEILSIKRKQVKGPRQKENLPHLPTPSNKLAARFYTACHSNVPKEELRHKGFDNPYM